MGVVLLAMAAIFCVCALTYGASTVITWASGRSALYSLGVAIGMAAGFVGLVTVAASIMRTH